MDKFKNYKFGNITKGVTKTVVGDTMLGGSKIVGLGVVKGTETVGKSIVK